MTDKIYETDEILSQYLVFHYGASSDQMPWEFGPKEALFFPKRCIQEGVDLDRIPTASRGLDIGCAVGRSSFELAQYCDEVIGIDYSHRFIEAASDLRSKGQLTIDMVQTGELSKKVEIKAPIKGENIQFQQGDAQFLPDNLGTFDVVLAANLLCRLQQPKLFLDRLASLINPGGQLIVTTPNTWLETFTAKDYWLGGTSQAGEPIEALKKELSSHFSLNLVWNMPFLIREHVRKYQWSVAQASRWIRKS